MRPLNPGTFPMNLRFGPLALGGVAALTAALLASNDARACGGCFHPENQPETTVVTGHRMALSISTTQTVLWDQVQYSGSPSEFAWVLPVKPGARIELANNAWFEALDAATSTRVIGPALDCPQAPRPRAPRRRRASAAKAAAAAAARSAQASTAPPRSPAPSRRPRSPSSTRAPSAPTTPSPSTPTSPARSRSGSAPTASPSTAPSSRSSTPTARMGSTSSPSASSPTRASSR